MTDFAGAFWLAIRSRIDYTAGALGRRLHHLIDIALASTGFSKAVSCRRQSPYSSATSGLGGSCPTFAT